MGQEAAKDPRESEKLSLECEKLSLEKRLLQRQLSARNLLMGWLQAASVPVALLGAILAFFVGFGQLRQGADNQAADRFDKALTRLASERPDERMTGVSGLNLFLSDGSPLLQKQALQFLVNGLSLETDLRVQGAILDVLADLLPGRPSQAALDEGLRAAIERDRSLTKSIVREWHKRSLQQQKQILAKFKIPALDLDGMTGEVPAQVLAALSADQYLALLDAEHGPFRLLDNPQSVPLIGLSTAIQTLLARGATSDDFKQIYCENCNFSTARSFDGALFDDAYLAEADFSHVSLRGASFSNADIRGANFFDADLTKANLSHRNFWLGLASRGYSARQLPLFECAKLNGADLSGQPLMLFAKEFDAIFSSEPTYVIEVPRMLSVQLDASTRLDKFSITTAIRISDDYLKKNPSAPEVKPLTTDRIGAGWENPLAEGEWASADFLRIHGTFAEEASKYTHTIAVVNWQYGPDDLGRLGKDAFMLRGYVDQPTLKALPLYSRFAGTVSALKAPDSREGRASQAWSDKAAQAWATIKPISCSEHPQTGALLLDLGDHAL